MDRGPRRRTSCSVTVLCRTRPEAAASASGRASAGARVAALGQELDLVSPQAVLERGYAIVTRAGGEVVRAASEEGAAESLGVRLASGALDVKVTGRRG